MESGSAVGRAVRTVSESIFQRRLFVRCHTVLLHAAQNPISHRSRLYSKCPRRLCGLDGVGDGILRAAKRPCPGPWNSVLLHTISSRLVRRQPSIAIAISIFPVVPHEQPCKPGSTVPRHEAKHLRPGSWLTLPTPRCQRSSWWSSEDQRPASAR